MGLLDLEMIEQPHRVLDHFGAILLDLGGFAAFAVAAKIQGDDAMVFRQSLDNARQAPLKLSVDSEAVNQQHRLALALKVVVDFDAVGVERAFLDAADAGEKRNNRKRVPKRNEESWNRPFRKEPIKTLFRATPIDASRAVFGRVSRTGLSFHTPKEND